MKKNSIQLKAVVSLGGKVETELLFTVKAEAGKDETSLYWDDVDDAAYVEAMKMYPSDSFPKMTVKEILIEKDFDGKKEVCPIIPESKVAEYEKSQKYHAFLALPEYTYQLTPECELWMTLKEHGLIDEDSEFDFDKYHKILETMNRKDD